MKLRVDNVTFGEAGGDVHTVLLQDERLTAELVVGTNGINSAIRECLVGHSDKPAPTWDLTYGLLFKTKDMIKDPELRKFVTNLQVNYWMGPDAHAGIFPFPLNERC